jgi:hypothetical protein
MQTITSQVSRQEVEDLLKSEEAVSAIKIWSTGFCPELTKVEAFYLVRNLELSRQTDIFRFGRIERNNPPYINSIFIANVKDAIAKEGLVTINSRILSEPWANILEEFS